MDLGGSRPLTYRPELAPLRGLADRPNALLREHRVFVALSAGAVVLLILATRGAGFWRDEVNFMQYRSFADPASWFLPHAEHLVAVHAAVYTALLAIFGTGSYLPFLAVTWAAHIAFVAAIYVLVDRHVGRGPALVTAAILLVIGHASMNLYWAFQMGPIASGALALWGLIVIRQWPRLAAELMALGVATAGFALFVVPAAALYGWSRRALLAASVPVMLYATWYLLIGHRTMVEYGIPTAAAPSTLAESLAWIPGGVSAAAATLTGLGPLGVVVLLAAALLLLRTPNRLAAAGILALLTEYAILGVTRPGLAVPAGWQYVYFGAAFVALIFAAAWPAVPRWGRPLAVGLVGIALATNVLALFAWSSTWSEITSIPYDQCTNTACWVPR
jgi:hypothetical protein